MKAIQRLFVYVWTCGLPERLGSRENVEAGVAGKNLRTLALLEEWLWKKRITRLVV
jgi:hypothetical protein